MSRFEVVCKCGHVGRNNYIEISFPVTANSKKDAAAIARMIPRVKHHHKDAILRVSEITEEEYFLLVEQNKRDPYLRCHNIQEQNRLDLCDGLILEKRENKLDDRYEGHYIFYKKNKVKNPKRFFKNLAMIEKFNMEVALW